MVVGDSSARLPPAPAGGERRSWATPRSFGDVAAAAAAASCSALAAARRAAIWRRTSASSARSFSAHASLRPCAVKCCSFLVRISRSRAAIRRAVSSMCCLCASIAAARAATARSPSTRSAGEAMLSTVSALNLPCNLRSASPGGTSSTRFGPSSQSSPCGFMRTNLNSMESRGSKGTGSLAVHVPDFHSSGTPFLAFHSPNALLEPVRQYVSGGAWAVTCT
mmetsp:Transcript_38280/g.110035  ORF Transcript_38280/g.110035 Transcript_38280/m.110035 type:complete len:222 (+) Transcript_38280:1560-2225(+)